MKYKMATILFLLTIMSLVACFTNSDFNINKSEVDGIEVSSFEDFGSTNEDYHIFFEEKEDIKTFVKAINTSMRIAGDVDMPKGDYNFVLNFNDGSSKIFHLWISKDYSTGTIMKIDDTATAYKLGKSATDQIRLILTK